MIIIFARNEYELKYPRNVSRDFSRSFLGVPVLSPLTRGDTCTSVDDVRPPPTEEINPPLSRDPSGPITTFCLCKIIILFSGKHKII